MYLKNNKNFLLFKRFLIVLSIILFLTITFIGCSNIREVKNVYKNYMFPLQKENIEYVLKENALSWTVNVSDSNISQDKEYTNFSLLNNENKFICRIHSNINNQGRCLKIEGFPPTIEEIELIYEEDWQDLFEFAFTLYGNSQQCETVYNQFINYIKNKKDNEVMYLRKRIDDTHITIYFARVENKPKEYFLKSITIMDTNSFEAFLKSREEIWEDILNEYDIESLGSLNISEISSMKNDNTDFVKGVIIRGRLENIQELKSNEINQVIPKSNLISYNEAFLTANLIDDTGSIPVILRSTSLDKDELKDLRKHHIYYFNKSRIYIVNFSVK